MVIDDSSNKRLRQLACIYFSRLEEELRVEPKVNATIFVEPKSRDVRVAYYSRLGNNRADNALSKAIKDGLKILLDVLAEQLEEQGAFKKNVDSNFI